MEDSYVLQLLEPKFKEFHLCFCGFAQCEPLHSYGPASRPNYIIHYIMDGKGIYQVGEKKYKLSKGQGFLIEPEELTFYQADQEEPWSYLWVGVGGTGAKKFIQDIGLNSQQRIFRCADGEKLNEIVMDMMKHTRSTVSDLYYLQGKLYELFSVLAADVVIEELMEENKENRYIQEAVTYIRNHYAAGLTVEELAGYLGVNRSYLYTLFKNKLQLSPKEFLTKFRISRAREQLILTEESVENIAVACGYHSTLVFTKNFKQETGMTPTEFRKTNRQAAKDRLLMNQKSPGTGKN
ncbi:AraC family transcriptional regulator [bacterium]|uniref:AraC family transcriptional regulator n=1 Tax=unclassified Bariatricus TaxID=2677046 RepID=UPI002A7E8109|nr:AraC family transcriptional regulator [bacterium]MCI7149228.1 AraC family transcriptional regulator [bacterium]MDY2885899.1 AraC family transcriptional regulator [Bariatricus sp.]MDY4502725.1 AraC family transcriptional regulator [Bariatricus sp.]